MPSDVGGAFDVGWTRVFPKRFFVSNSSSYQFECLVASLLDTNGVGVAETGCSSSLRGALVVDEAVTAALLRRLLILRPSSSSDDVKSESEAGGGASGFLRKLALALADRFLKEN